ncbi:carboxypeptidase-like regulatory domain-containing protein [Fulvivirga lutimaris]|uniref:carboxypeptidase-like regulatory domain-containing protein n=1 Tax=Fulvivirga lutimaris TaxID=1819566 RepID=UPI0012BB8148|nr:carboxypeptidase-like regulatory domain-containing protein [Fulvivirga lutimaris]MTI39590.1 carboxypeptidase regulatory-like domain-containing protein [Fulvivirga lutimaris]
MKNILNQRILPVLAVLFLISIVTSCKDDDEGTPTVGTLKGIITDGSSTDLLADASVIVFNADDNAPVASLLSDGDGVYSIDLEEGNYFVKVYRQDYLSVPAPGLSSIPFSIVVGQTTENDITLFPSNDTNVGFISGTVAAGGNAVPGALVVASNGTNAFSGVSDADGKFVIFNVTSGSYTVSAWLAGYNSDNIPVSVTTDSEATNTSVSLTQNASGSLSGQVRNISAGNIDVDVALVHPITRETIPGLIGRTTSQAYSLSNIPDGEYIARATFENDNRVMDPDRIFKFGEPQVTMTGAAESIDFDITNSITVNDPTNDASTTAPMEITSTTPTFSWTAYSSTSDYVIEVTDATTGQVIWGGFDTSGADPVKNIVIPSSSTSIDFNEDSNASISALEVGKVYRWRVFASKNDQNSPTGWTLISASEDQLGLIKIVE